MENLVILTSQAAMLLNLLRKEDDSGSLKNHVLDKLNDILYSLEQLCRRNIERVKKLDARIQLRDDEIDKLTREVEELRKQPTFTYTQKINAIAALRSFCEEKGRHLGLKDAKELVEAIAAGDEISCHGPFGNLNLKVTAHKKRFPNS